MGSGNLDNSSLQISLYLLKSNCMKGITYFRATLLSILAGTIVNIHPAHGQAEIEPWGNIKGIRIEGQLMQFESSLRVIGTNWSTMKSTAKERQQPHYSREGHKQIVTIRIDSLYFTEEVEDMGAGTASVKLSCEARADTKIEGVFFSIGIPGITVSDSTAQLIDQVGKGVTQATSGGPGEYLRPAAGGVRLSAPHRQ